jgi:hypothetical protein
LKSKFTERGHLRPPDNMHIGQEPEFQPQGGKVEVRRNFLTLRSARLTMIEGMKAQGMNSGGLYESRVTGPLVCAVSPPCPTPLCNFTAFC